MGGYLGAAAAKPLVMTGQLDKMTPRRLVETSKFWIDATAHDGMTRYADGFKSAVRVRLMHAQIRAMLLQSDNWDPAWGHPLNQWDSMGTILEFSSIMLLGLRLLGFLFTRREREAVVHQWRYIGYVMGVDERMLPTSEADSMRALYAVIATAPTPDEDSRALGQALAEVTLQFAGEGVWQQRSARLERILRIGYTRYVLGDKAGDALGLPRTAAKYFWAAQLPLRLTSELARSALPPLNRWMVKQGEKTLQAQFRRRVALTRPNVNFEPVKTLAR